MHRSQIKMSHPLDEQQGWDTDYAGTYREKDIIPVSIHLSYKSSNGWCQVQLQNDDSACILLTHMMSSRLIPKGFI